MSCAADPNPRWRSSSNGWRRPTWCWWRASSRPPSRASRSPAGAGQAGAARGGRRLPGRGHGRGAGNDARCDAAMPAAERAGRGGGVHLQHAGARAGESLGFPAGRPGPPVTGRRRTTLAPCRPGQQDIHDPYRFQNRPRRPAVTPASPVHAHHRHVAGRVGGGAVHDQLDAVAVLAAGGAGAAINDTGSLRMRANRVAVELMRPQEGASAHRRADPAHGRDHRAAGRAIRPGRCSFPMTKASAGSGARWPATGARS